MPNQTLKGFRDFLPEAMVTRNKVIAVFRQVFELYGFSELQTPTLEYADVLTGKYGEDAEKLMYLFSDPGRRRVGLKYDLTVPLARVMSEYPNLPKPFKRYQIQPVFRAENTQKGRYREFWQCDIDTVGSSSLWADAEILAVLSDCLTALGFSGFTIRLNSRQILYDLIIKSGIPSSQTMSVLQSVDKLDKKSEAEVEQELLAKNLSLDQVANLFGNLSRAKPDPDLKQIITMAGRLGAKNIRFDPGLVRGLDYYTGAIFETVVTEPKIGSITGGGRYDNLISSLGGPNLPAVGSTLGLERIIDVITDLELWSLPPRTATRVLVTVFSPDLVDSAVDLAVRLRKQSIPAEIFPDPEAKLDRQLKYAAAMGIPYAAILGPEELDRNTVGLKDMKSGTQTELSIAEVIAQLVR